MGAGMAEMTGASGLGGVGKATRPRGQPAAEDLMSSSREIVLFEDDFKWNFAQFRTSPVTI